MLRYIAPLLCCAGIARADTPPVTTYALVVGSNAAGPGQTALKYAEDDARRVGAILGELGGVSPGNVDIVLQPSPQKLRESIDKLTQRVAADNAAGKQSRIFFYYSGHARATAIDLGPQGLPLAELRQRLLAVPATLTVVVLDACQSGAFSRVKGATPAADFSFNSRQQLDATGVAVLASSSGSELSQESEQLKSSYFTHHLLVGMRGAGDANSDGIVSVDEAYRYAYHQTLISTASTAVGGQHVSLEVDLKGHGEVALAFPRAATRSIVLPAALEGQALVHDKRSKTVVAETYKAKGAPTRIAVAPGEYEVMVRQGTQMRRCQVSTVGRESTVDLERCSTESVVTASRKGGGFERPWHLEVTGTMGSERRDGYTETLENFGYKEGFLDPARGLGIAVSRRIHEKLWVGGSGTWVHAPRWTRETDEMPLRFDWNTTTLLATVKGVHLLADEGVWSRFGFYAQLGAGLAIGRTQLLDQDDEAHRETHFGPALSAGAGIHLGSPGYYRRVPSVLMPISMTLGYELVYASAITNNTGDTHASGGHRLTLGFGYDF
ncbi:MAG: caspase family protein [Myxococcota bacterium]|nr:caspase family protein [Deltaproteobacteria bacterium]MDQ3341114.1 caspase family protein [Myxococcota bacterium]